jgi:hypothetical protein
MRNLSPLATCAALLGVAAAPAVLAQSSLPRLRVPAAFPVLPGSAASFTCDTTALPGALFVVLADVSGGPTDLFGVRYQLGLTPALLTVFAGRIPASGQASVQLLVRPPAGLIGVPLHLQSLVLNPAAPNLAFELSNGESTAFVRSGGLHVERFDHPAAEGFTGGFDRGLRDRLQGGAVRRRLHSTTDPQGVSFGQGIATPLSHHGVRAQFCYRRADVGSAGEAELLTAIRWRSFGASLSADRFDRLQVLAAHSDVVPDYTIDPWSALPAFPNSGLAPICPNNVKAGETLQSLYDGAYAIGPGDLRGDGYVDYPLARAFAYNGADSLLLEVRVAPSAVPGSGANGQIVRLMVQSSPRPDARLVRAGRVGAPIDPDQVQSGQGDNAMHDLQLEFVRVRTVAISPWRFTGNADFQTPIVARVVPAGTSLEIEYRGADDGHGGGATAWSTNIDGADGKSFLQFRVTFIGDPRTGEVPALDSLLIPLR